MIQDIEPKRLCNQYQLPKQNRNDYIAVFSGNQILIKETNGRLELPKRADMEAAGCALHADTYLFCIDDDRYFLCPEDVEEWEAGNKADVSDNRAADFRRISMRQLREEADHELCFAVYTAYHLYQWYKNNRFCGCCGNTTVPDKKERMLFCAKCGNQIYPRIAPAVIAAVTNGDSILLTKYANREYKRYALIAGFTEIGETAEDTVRREVMEETGIRVKNIRYYKSQPWGIDGNLLLGYFAELDGSDRISIDENELSCAEWVRRDQLKDMDDSFSLTREMMRVFYEKHDSV